MEYKQFNQAPASPSSNEVVKPSILEKKQYVNLHLSVIVAVLELGLIFFYAYSAADQILQGSWALLGALAFSIYIGIPLFLIGIILAFKNYKQGKKILALILFTLSISVTPFFAGSLGQVLAPVLFPAVKQHEKEYLKSFETAPYPQPTQAELDNIARESHLVQFKDNYLNNRYSELEKSFAGNSSIEKIVSDWDYAQLSDGRRIGLIYCSLHSPKALEEIGLKNIRVELPSFDDFRNEYLLYNNLTWTDSAEQTVGLVCPSDLVSADRENSCIEKIPALVYSNKILVNELSSCNPNKEALVKYELR